MKKVGPCDDPPSALTTILLGIEGDPCVKLPETENWREELLKAREVLKRGVPCPSDEERKTIDVFMLAYTPGEKVVFCQIRRSEKGERILEFMEETWGGEQIFYHPPIFLITTTNPLKQLFRFLIPVTPILYDIWLGFEKIITPRQGIRQNDQILSLLLENEILLMHYMQA